MIKKSKVILAIAVILAVGLLTCACTPGAEDEEGAGELSPKHGGVLHNAFHSPSKMDPAFLASASDDHICRQWSDYLVFIDEDNEPDIDRSVAENWEMDETGKVWTFQLREGIKFHDGKEMTSRDIKFTYDRLRDPDVGAATVELYSNIEDVSADDDYTVVFQLKEPNLDFLKDAGDYHACVMDADNEDFDTNWNGTGPFIIESYSPEDKLVFKRNPNYWMQDEEGYQLPYLDGIEVIFVDDPSAQVEALRGGQVDYLACVSTEFAPVLEEDSGVEIYKKLANTMFFIHMRSDRGPAEDVRVRQAFKAATDRAEILDGAVGGLGVTGRDTPISEIYGDLYLDAPEPQQDLERAKELLAEAGYPDGLDITLHTPQQAPAPAIATIWKEQMSKAGVNVEIQLVPSDVYYGDDVWLEVDFGVTPWASRPYPQPYLDLALVSGAAWNQGHWSDKEFDELSMKASSEIDLDKRVEHYHRIQEILIERGPVIIPYFVNNLWAARTNVKGLKPTSAMDTQMDLRWIYFED